MPVLPSPLLNPLWEQFATHLPPRPEFDPTHPLGCHRRRISDRVVFDLVIAALVHGSGLERIAVPGCSDRTIRRRLHDWAEAGIGHDVFTATLAAYDTMIGLDLSDVSVDGSITKAVGGGTCAGRSPVDRGKGGTKRSVLVDAAAIPLHVEVAAANCHDSPLLAPTLAGGAGRPETWRCSTTGASLGDRALLQGQSVPASMAARSRSSSPLLLPREAMASAPPVSRAPMRLT